MLRITSLLTCILLVCLLPTRGHAQNFSGGFRAGLNFVSLSGPSEQLNGEDLETFNRTTGFHVAATFAYEVTDLFGLKAELMYSQKGGEVRYEGPSYFYFYADAADRQGVPVTGQLMQEIDYVNSYVDIPLMAYYRLGPLELEGGVSAGLLINSRASGTGVYNNTDPNYDGAEIIFNYDFNYLGDPIGGAAVLERADNPLPRTQLFPPTVIQAFYNAEDDTPLFERLDFGLVVGLSYFLDNGLFIGGRYQLGLTDATRGEADRRQSFDGSFDGREYNTDDDDRNRNIQVSVGFRF